MIPDVCPVCGAKTEREKDTADIKCTSPNCPAQLERHIINFVGRDAMDIKGFGTVYIEELVRLGYIKDIADIFELKDHRGRVDRTGYYRKRKEYRQESNKKTSPQVISLPEVKPINTHNYNPIF